MNTLLSLLLVCLLARWSSADTVESCDSKIYCQGKLLDYIQRARLYKDSKTFVDKACIKSVEETLKDFDELLKKSNNNPSKDDLNKFVEEHFEDSNELEEWSPPDYNPNPKFLRTITDPVVRLFATNLTKIWPTLGRKVKSEIEATPEQHSLISLPNGFIVPGGRFQEIYYWDSLWIVKGLMLSEMTDTVKGILENFLSLVQRYGFIPNGSRVYYLNRSQLPVLTAMVHEYMKVTKNVEWLKKNIDLIESELAYFLKEKSITVTRDNKNYTMLHYNSKSGTPRPESYAEDITTASYIQDKDGQIECYKDLKSGAESGWDFSTRWFFNKEGGNDANLTSIKTRRVIPVDLNAVFCRDLRLIEHLYEVLGNKEKQKYWNTLRLQWQTAVEEVLFNDEDKIWYDWDVELGQHRKYFYPSNFAPLWAEVVDPKKVEQYGDWAANYFLKSNITKYKGGIPTSLKESGQQWDLPYAWPPLQEIVITGLQRSGSKQALAIAEDWAKKWINSNMLGFVKDGTMYEKYDANTPGKRGGGGEYDVQSGFGWTNGVVLKFIDTFYTKKSSKEPGYGELPIKF